MSDAPKCEPPPDLRGVDGWHWVQCADEQPRLLRWIWDRRSRMGFWGPWVDVKHYCYLSPALTPTEAATLRAERDAAIALLALPEHSMAQRIFHLQTSIKFLADIARSLGFANRKQETNEQLVGRALRELAARTSTPPQAKLDLS